MDNLNQYNNAASHSIERAFEIYGVRLTFDDLVFIKKQIIRRSKQVEFASHSMNAEADFYFVTLNPPDRTFGNGAGVRMKVLFSKTTNRVLTIVPLEFRTDVTRDKNAERRQKFFRTQECEE